MPTPARSRTLRSLLVGVCLGGVAFTQETSPAPEPAPAQAPAPIPVATTPAPAPEATTPAAPAETKPEEPAFARLVCYREKKFAGMALHHTIYFDDQEVGNLNNGTYFVIKAMPGEHRLCADDKKDEFTFKVEASKTYYFHTELKIGFWKGHGKITPVEASFGEKEFNEWKDKLKYSPSIAKADILEMP